MGDQKIKPDEEKLKQALQHTLPEIIKDAEALFVGKASAISVENVIKFEDCEFPHLEILSEQTVQIQKGLLLSYSGK